MPVQNSSMKFAYQLLIFVAIMQSPPLILADTSKQQQWVCKAQKQDQWQCSFQAQPSQNHRSQQASNSNKLATPNNTNTKGPGDTDKKAHSNQSQWDWTPKSQLNDPSICNTGCDGAFVQPPANWPKADQSPELSNSLVEAGSFSDNNNVAQMAGGVEITQGHRRILADRATINRSTEETTLEGNIEIREPNLLIRAQSARYNTDSGVGNFHQTQFVLHKNSIRGSAQNLQRSTVDTLTIEQGSVTQCSPVDETWLFEADSIVLDQETGLGTAKKAKLKVKNIPIFYTPYITFPIDDRRTSGFLWPSFGTSGDSGFDITSPYYFNIAPNIDATLAPRHITERGTMLEAEARYLNQYGQWLVGAAKLSDNMYENIQDDSSGITQTSPANLSARDIRELPPQENRWLAHIEQQGNIAGIGTRIDYSKVSDNEYFRDLSVNSLDIKRTSHLNQSLALDYQQTQWHASLIAQQSQTLDEDLNNQYKLMPRLSIERNGTTGNFATQWLMQTQISNFQHDDDIDKGGEFVTGQRVYAETGFRYPMRWAGGFVIPTIKIRHLNYELDDIDQNTNPSANTTINTTTPVATMDMGLIFERSAHYGKSNFTQTLEPRVYYFYSEFKDQSDHPDFDTRELTFSYSQLFRDSRFSGHDRLDDANQLSIGISSRLIEQETGREVLSASIGQTFFFEDRQVTLENSTEQATRGNSYLASSIQYQPIEQFWLNNNLLWDTEQNKLQEGGVSFHYQTSGNSLYNFNYRYRRMGDRNLVTGIQHLEQVESSFLLPISDKWSVYSRVKYDITEQNGIDSMLGMQYESCCWKLSLLYQEGFEDEFIDEPEGTLLVENDYAFVIEIQLKGLGGLGSKTTSILKESILGYEDLE